MPDVEQGCCQGEEDGAEDYSDGAEGGDASEDGEQDGGGVGAQAGADEDRVEDVVDGADDDRSPDGEERGFAPMSSEAEIDCYWSPDEVGAEGGDHGAGGEGEGPEDDAGNSKDPEGEAGEDALHGGDGEAAERCGEDGVAGSVEEFCDLVFAEGKERAKGDECESAVAEEEEQEEEHDDELGDDADGVAEKAGEIASEISGDAAKDVVDVDGVGEVLDAGGETGTIGDEVIDLLLMGSAAEGVDGAEGLFADFLREEEGGDDDREGDDDECDGGAEGAVFDLCGEPVVGALRDDGEDDCEDNRGEEGFENQSAEDDDGEGDEEEGDLLPWCYIAALLHSVVAPFLGWMRGPIFSRYLISIITSPV